MVKPKPSALRKQKTKNFYFKKKSKIARVFFPSLHNIYGMEKVMWEFSISLDSKQTEVANSIFDMLRADLSPLNAVVAESIDGCFINILVAVDDLKRSETEVVLLKIISLSICQNYKLDFLNKHLFLPVQDLLSLEAFKKALINFDKETDYFIISKALNFDEYLYLDSFYRFKLAPLRDKWRELIRLANENRDYLISSDAFFDLIKFLIDNLDICNDEIIVVEDEQGYYIYEEGKKSKILSSAALIGNLIDLSPQKINLYYKNENHATFVLKNIFDRRINLMSQDTKMQKFDAKTFAK